MDNDTQNRVYNELQRLLGIILKVRPLQISPNDMNKKINDLYNEVEAILEIIEEEDV